MLLLATALTTTLYGGEHYYSFLLEFGNRAVQPALTHLFPGGLWYSLAILTILGAHEMGHYLTCRFHRIDATLPYFIPMPIAITGTMGAVIRIREPFPTRAILFDVGVSGPIAGFIVLIPLLFAGLYMSNVRALPADFIGYSLGEPLLFTGATWIVWGTIPAGHSLNMHPLVFAAWFGLLATAWNLLPYGQLDGGHITYALFGSRATKISYVTLAAVVVLTFLSWSWLFFAAVLVLMAILGAVRHPPVTYDSVRLDRGRQLIALLAGVILILSFTPKPFEIYAAIRPLTER